MSYDITIRGETYPIHIGTTHEAPLLEVIAKVNAAKIAIITDKNVQKHWGKEFIATIKKSGVPTELFSFPAGEKNKNQKTVTALQHALLKKRYGRDTLIIAIGGGVVGDLAGFVAATYLRGVPYVHVPTTVLAMVDSSIGGKVGIDTQYGKNTIGAFYQPKAVIADLRFVTTQKKDHVINGLLEAIKTFLTSDKQVLELVEKIDVKNPARDLTLLQQIVERSVHIKGDIVMRDETEQNERKVINFGHTVGHAVELLSKFKLMHGYCVGYGMLAEARIAESLGILPSLDRVYLEGLMKQFGIDAKPLKRFSITKILEATRADKKTLSGVPQYVLLKEIGAVHTTEGKYAHPVSDDVVARVLKAI
jgi:3-dehydroquinate synthase